MGKKRTMNKKYNIHHICPRSRAPEGYDIGHELNLKRLRVKFHQRIHTLFDNMLPHEQLALWFEVNAPVLSPEVRSIVSDVMTRARTEFYREEVLAEPTGEYADEGYDQEKQLVLRLQDNMNQKVRNV